MGIMRTRVPIGSGPWTRPAGSYRCSGGGDSGSGPFVRLPSVWAVSNRSDRPGSEVEATSGGYRGWAVRPDREPDPLDSVPRLLIDPPPALDPAPDLNSPLE